jgi:mono/diheme cytochrome c family protein
MPASKMRIIGIVMVVAYLLAACAGPATPQPTPTSTPLPTNPADTTRLERGGLVFQENCAVCHGADGQGRVGATLSKDWGGIRPDLPIKSIIVNGVPGSAMPAWAQTGGGPLTTEQIDDVVYYILSWQTAGVPDLQPRPTFTPRPPIATLPSVEGDPNRGALLFAENCQMCHGADGQGRVGASLAKAWGSIRPDLAVKQIITNGIPGSAMPAWEQTKGGPLSEKEINDLTSFILALESTTTNVAPVQPEEKPLSWMSGPAGILVFLVLAAALFGAIWFFQRGERK